LIEALVVMALLAIIAGLAGPSLRDFIVRNQVASLSNEFSSALFQTRALAVSKNSCASICASSSVGSDDTPACNDDDAENFQAGWLIFVNPSCDDAQIDPALSGATITTLRRGDDNGYAIGSAVSIVMFDARGYANLAGPAIFQVAPPAGTDDSFRRTICIDAAGRASIRAYTEEC